MSKKTVSLLATLILTISTAYLATHAKTMPPSVTATQSAQHSTPSDGTTAVLGAQTKMGGCVARGALPDNACTPGAVFSGVTTDQICKSGYSKSVRNVPTATKNKVFSEYGVTSHAAGEYEVDHLVSLELGGSNDIANLWPEPADPTPGFHEKDVVENYLHSQLCTGKISLAQAQQSIATDWLSVYKTIQ